MTDNMGRTIDYIRISVTDRCNLRCRYCMPEDGVELMDHGDILTYQEIVRLCRIGAELGITKVKITGGEPLVRKGIDTLIGDLCRLEGIGDVTMTSNGCLLGKMAPALKKAGLSSANVSLDTLDPERFAYITRRDNFGQVLEGINQAVQAGIEVKINCAVMEELQEADVLAFAEFSRQKQIPVRFIEMMPIGQGRKYHALDNDDLIRILRAAYPDLREDDTVRGNGPAVYYTYAGGRGCVGFISAVHHRFCGACNRVRLTSDGFLKLCLDSSLGVDLRTPLRTGETDQEIKDRMAQWIAQKPESHHFEKIKEEAGPNMNQIGG